MKRQILAIISLAVLAAFAYIFRGELREIFNLNPESKKSALNNGEVRVYNWSHYISDDVVRKFRAQTGIKVIYDTYSSNEEMYARVMDGSSGYDIVFPSDYMVAIMARQGLLSPIQIGRLGNYKNLDPAILEKAVAYDPGNTFAVPYMWGTVGIGYDSERVDPPPKSLADLKREGLRGRVAMIDDARFGLGTVLKFLGHSANTVDRGELDQAVEWLLTLKPYLLGVDSEKYLTQLESGEAWVAIGFSGDVAQVAEARPSVRYIIPSEGAVLWVDNMVVLRESRNKDNAHQFVNFLLDADNGARIANVIRYASANLAARGAGMDVELLKDRSVFPGPDVMEKSEVLEDLGDKNDLYGRSWLEFLGRQDTGPVSERKESG